MCQKHDHQQSSDAASETGLIGWLALKFIRLYQIVLSPLFGANCRYYPSCSTYAMEAIRIHGGLMGLWLALRRILRCHPFGGHGWDPVPLPEELGKKK